MLPRSSAAMRFSFQVTWLMARFTPAMLRALSTCERPTIVSTSRFQVA